MNGIGGCSPMANEKWNQANTEDVKLACVWTVNWKSIKKVHIYICIEAMDPWTRHRLTHDSECSNWFFASLFRTFYLKRTIRITVQRRLAIWKGVHSKWAHWNGASVGAKSFISTFPKGGFCLHLLYIVDSIWCAYFLDY